MNDPNDARRLRNMSEANDPRDAGARPPSAKRALGMAALVTVVVSAMSHLLPLGWAGGAVGVAFPWASYRLVAHDADSSTVRHFGLSLGGLFEPEPIDWRRALRETLVALRWALGEALVVFPPFLVGFVAWWRPLGGFSPAPLSPVFDDALGQVLMVALPATSPLAIWVGALGCGGEGGIDVTYLERATRK